MANLPPGGNGLQKPLAVHYQAVINVIRGGHPWPSAVIRGHPWNIRICRIRLYLKNQKSHKKKSHELKKKKFRAIRIIPVNLNNFFFGLLIFGKL